MGVDVFFVLSGMLMSIVLFEKRMSLRDFYIRRFSRIYPALLVFVAAMTVFALLFSIEFKWTEVLSSLLFMRTYLPEVPGIWGSGLTTAHLWSLNVEEHAYVFLSAITLILISRKAIAAGLLVCVLSLMILGFYQYATIQADDFKLFLIRTESAVIFVLFSAGYGLLARKNKWVVAPWVPPLFLLIAMVCYAQTAPLWLIFTVCPVMLGVAVNHLQQIPELLKKILSNSALRHFGLWSYSIYLWQQFFYEFAWRVPGGKVVALLLAILTGVMSYYFLEQPVRHWINKKWSIKPRYRKAPV